MAPDSNPPRTGRKPAPPERLWDVAELAEYLGVPKSYVYRINREGRIRYVRIGKHVRYQPHEVAAYLERESEGRDH